MENRTNSSEQNDLAKLLSNCKESIVIILESPDFQTIRSEESFDLVNIWNDEIRTQLLTDIDYLNTHHPSPEELAKRGMFGKQLVVKSRILKKFKEIYKNLSDKIRERIPFIYETISDLLNFIKSILGSLSPFIPYSEPIIEFIDSLQAIFNINKSELALYQQS